MPQESLFDTDARVVKSNRFVQSKMNWTKLEHRVVASLIAQLGKDDEQFQEQRIYIKDIADLSGRSGKSLYDQAEKICKKLLDQKIHVRTETEDGRRRYKGYNCMSSCQYVEGSGYIEAKFTEDMRPLLLQLKRRFTQYDLERFMKLSSQHTMRIYELLKMREGLRYLRISIKELREVLCCEHSYDRFADFKRWVLDNAQEELKKKGDIYFTYKVERDGQTPVRVNFMIKQNEGAQENGEPKLIRSEGNNGTRDIGVEEQESDNTSTPQFNVVAMVLDKMSQDELDSYSQNEIERAVEAAEERVTNNGQNRGKTNTALAVYRSALSSLRGT